MSIIGYPLGHSISPEMQQAALDHYELDIEYEAWETNPLQLAGAVSELRRPRNLGANVTIPFKEAVIPLLDDLDEIADEIGAVNTIVKRDDLLVGHNTDALGFIRALTTDGEFSPKDKVAALIGAGGAARAVSVSLLNAGVSRLLIINRFDDRGVSLVEDLNDLLPRRGLQTEIDLFGPERETADDELYGCDLIVNCTPLGMKHSGHEKRSALQADQIPSKALVFDLVYNPEDTVLLKEAQKAGARTLGGLHMLVYQGAAAFELWTGKEAPIDVMFDAARGALR